MFLCTSTDSYAALRESVAEQAVSVAEHLELSNKDNARKSTETAMQVGACVCFLYLTVS